MTTKPHYQPTTASNYLLSILQNTLKIKSGSFERLYMQQTSAGKRKLDLWIYGDVFWRAYMYMRGGVCDRVWG